VGEITTILLVIIILLVLVLIYLNIKKDTSKTDSTESIREIDRSVGRQESALHDLSKDIQTFQEPLTKLNRYLSGGTLAGTFGEWSLDAIIKDIFHANQYLENEEIIKGSGKRVEFAIKLPEGLLLPIDAKFPSAKFDNYLAAVDKKDKELIKRSREEIRRHIKKDAQDIHEKYIQSGVTIDLGVMYIPSESMMQLIDSIDNIREQIFRDDRVLMMGPNSLAAYLISIHMGFRTLALNERAGDIMKEFGKLKKEFERFSSSTEELSKKTDAVLKAVNEHATRERQMQKAINNMDQLDS
tara:strand:- start:401 stop:1294 length:894 start_codon:yes stop_codon:yes gene_type:complete